MEYRIAAGQFQVPADLEEFPLHPTESKERFYQWVIGRLKGLLRLQKVQVTCYGAEHIPAESGAIIAMNHTGYYDFMFGEVAPHIRGKRLLRFMAKREVFDVPVLGNIMNSMWHIPVDRSAGGSSVDAAVERIYRGQLVGIFPEATISRSFELANFKNGAARIAQQADAPLIPMVTWGSQRFWTKGREKELGRNGYPVIIRLGEPVDTTGTSDEVIARLKAAMQVLLDDVRAEYNERFGPFEPGMDWMPASMGGTAPTLEEADDINRRVKAEKIEKKKAKEARKINRRADRALKKDVT
ncbi:lysophospholipid acyltransferase family protein [Corynebacterium breve]|uniref:Lysophospholipid acyltransferase family protein n=1 Tax=Corynebacterium breve TaxID=3049799 RepID=A0ABY8VEJ3_9CORY|nr:lysophospholipid acyltransferase family protein [Corynebacterium breve]WIM67522.1 lysophospholipid acyltransferase family protein [Corynebacterium breve]